MDDQSKIKRVLIQDLASLRQRISELERSESERKLVEEELRESEEKYRSILENIEDGYFEVDRAGDFTFFNPSLCRILGYTREEMLGMNYRVLMDTENAEEVFQAFNEVYVTGIPIRGFEWETIRKDGARTYTEVSVSLIVRPGEKPTRFRGIVRDITERKQAEEALRESEKKYRELYDFLPIPVYEMDFEAKIISANRAVYETFRGTEEDFKKDSNAWQLLSPEDIDKSSKNIERLLKGEQVGGTEYTLTRLDGSAFPAIVISSVIYSNGKPVGLRRAIVDITERKRVEEELQHTLESLRKAFSAIVQVMVSAVESRDPYTAGHQVRSADLARAIAAEMGLPQEKIDGIRMAGSIHDIGKLSIPAEILSKPTKLTNIEFSLIKEHSLKGYEMLKDVESPWPLADIVHQHHERMDGSGYPRNLKGEEIIMEARILAASDVVESMASHRPYRAGLGIDAALEEIEKNRGILYDEAVVDTCLRLFREKGYQLKQP